MSYSKGRPLAEAREYYINMELDKAQSKSKSDYARHKRKEKKTELQDDYDPGAVLGGNEPQVIILQ